MKEEPFDPDVKNFICEKLKAACSPDQEVATCRERVYGYDELFDKMDCKDLQWASDLGMGDLIVTWHIATTICEELDGPVSSCGPSNQNIRFSGFLSRYCAYLLVSHANILPLHPDIAKLSYTLLHYELVPVLKEGREKLILYERETRLGFCTKLARQLLDRSREERWEILSGYWAGLVIYMAVYNKASLHAECLACGGEFLFQVWALLGHMGCGEQSDTVVTKKKEIRT
ncbi:hypothetical protein SUGI_0530530 [Cryptomeria japonica]|nr:hypothetical protein SUGI_0530530 [Cryptomeria japonica]